MDNRPEDRKPGGKPDNRKPLDNGELEKLPRNTIAKNMRNVEDIMADYIAGVDLSPDEERLLDRKVHEKTGKHIDKFKPKPPKPKFKGLVISKDGDDRGQIDATDVKVKRPKDPEISSKVVKKG